MKMQKLLIISLVLLFIVTLINISVYAGSATFRITGKGDGFIKTEGNTTTAGCNRKNENECDVVITYTF